MKSLCWYTSCSLWLSIAAIIFLQESINSWSGIVACNTSTIHRYNQSVIDCFIGQWRTLNRLQLVVVAHNTFSSLVREATQPGMKPSSSDVLNAHGTPLQNVLNYKLPSDCLSKRHSLDGWSSGIGYPHKCHSLCQFVNSLVNTFHWTHKLQFSKCTVGHEGWLGGLLGKPGGGGGFACLKMPVQYTLSYRIVLRN